jgi:hypothetical protein
MADEDDGLSEFVQSMANAFGINAKIGELAAVSAVAGEVNRLGTDVARPKSSDDWFPAPGAVPGAVDEEYRTRLAGH